MIMETLKKIDKMHSLFGITEGKTCKTCKHLKGDTGEYRKCRIYGISHSEATDFSLSYEACGMYNKDYDYEKHSPVYEMNKGRKKEEDAQCPGQMTLSFNTVKENDTVSTVYSNEKYIVTEVKDNIVICFNPTTYATHEIAISDLKTG